jgi:predicted PurR-regulated permease PerM
VLAFVLNFIPYIGPFIVMISLLFGGIISLPLLGQALIAPAAFVAITTIEGHFLTPSILGRHLTLSPLAVFLALAFWTWAGDRSAPSLQRRCSSSVPRRWIT